MSQEEKHLHKVYQVGDRSFPVYLEYDEQMGGNYPIFPDFEEYPEYTAEGRPFATAVQESCSYAKVKALEADPPNDCSDCVWFYRKYTPYDPIGICMCDARRCKPNAGEEQRE